MTNPNTPPQKLSKPMRQLLLGLVFLSILAAIGFLITSDDALGDAPNITATTINNHEISLNSSDAHRLVSFWATSCISCIEEMPKFSALKKQLNDKIEIIAIAMFYDPESSVRSFMDKHQYDFQTILDSDGSLAKKFGGISLTPTNFLVSPSGKILLKKIGKPNMELWRNAIVN